MHHSRTNLNQFALSAEDQTPVMPGRCQTVFTDVGQQHVLAVAGRSRPQSNGSAFAGASGRHIFGARTGSAALGIKSGMIDRPAHRHALGMAMRHRLQRAIAVKNRQAVRTPE